MNSASVVLTAEVSPPRSFVPDTAPETTLERSPAWPVAILGVPFDAVGSHDALARMESMIASRRPHYVVTANVDFLVQAHRDVELRRILIEADLVLCDGTPLLWASRWLGNALPERVAGSDLTPQLLRAAAERGHRVFFLGAGPGVAADAATRLQREYPTLQIAGHYSPPHAALLDMNHETIVQQIRDTAPDILLVSFGCPKQEKWISMHYRALGVPVCIGVGATLDFLAGRVKRAPMWMRRSGCEWLFRLCQEPRRLYRRYATDALDFMPALAAQSWRMSRPATAAFADTRNPTLLPAAGEIQTVEVGAALTRNALQAHARCWRRVQELDGHCVLDLSAVRRIDATGVGCLVKLRKALLGRSRQLVLAAPSSAVRAALRTLRLTDLFTISPTVETACQAIADSTRPHVVTSDVVPAIAWRDEVVAANVEEVWQTTADALRAFAERGATMVAIDLAALRFIDSSGAALMVRVKKLGRTLRTQILFTHPQPNVRNVLQLTRLEAFLLQGAQ